MEGKIHILFFCPYLNGGGAEMHLARLIKALDGTLFRKTLIVLKKGGNYEYLLEDVDVELISLDIKANSSAIQIIKSVIPLKKSIQHMDPDIVLSIMDYANVFCLLSHRLSKHRSKIIVDVQTSINKAIEFDGNLFNKFIFRWMKACYKNADRILSLSYGVSRELKALIPTTQDNQHVVIPNIGMEQKSFLPSTNKKSFQICVCGRLIPLKGFDLVIKAVALLAKEFPEIKLVILGSGSEEEKLKGLSLKLGVDRHIDFKGFVANVPEIINYSEIFVLSSYYEGFGNVIIEAMAVGTPVVATNCPYGPGEIIVNGENGILTEMGNSSEIAKAVKNLFLDRDLYKKIQENGYERAKEFTPERIAKQHELLFKSVIQE